MYSKFQNRSTFPSGRKVITLEEEKEKKKLTYEFNGHLSLPETRFRNQRSCQLSDNIRQEAGDELCQAQTQLGLVQAMFSTHIGLTSML